MAVGVEVVTRRLPGGEIVMFRFLFGLVTLQILSAGRVVTISHRQWKMLLGRGLSGGVAIIFYFLSIEKTTLTKSTLLGNAYPIFAAIFGGLILKERLSPATVGVFAASALGVWLVIDPHIDSLVVGDLYGVAAAMASGLAIVLIRQLRRTENPFSIFWYLCAVGAALGAATCIERFVWPNTFEWLMIVVIGINSTIGQLLITFGLRYSQAAEGALIAMSTTVYSGLVGWIFLGETMPASGLVGAALVLGGAAYLSTRPTTPAPSSSSV